MKFTREKSGAFRTEMEFGELSISSNTEVGYRPVHLLVSSIAGCSGGVFQKVLEKKRISYQSIEIEVDVERNEKEANRVTMISLHYIVTGEKLVYAQVEKSLHLASKNCAMIQSVKDAIEMIETLEIKEGLMG